MKTFKFADIIDKINDNNMSLMDILLYYETKRNEDIAKESKKEAKETEDYRHQEQFHNYKSQEDYKYLNQGHLLKPGGLFVFLSGGEPVGI